MSILQLGIVVNVCDRDYYIESLGQVDIVKDLGVLVDKCLKFDHHWSLVTGHYLR